MLFDDSDKRLLDVVEEKREESGNKRRLRKKAEETFDKVPSGPFGKGGDGDIAGAVGYLAVSTGKTAVLPIPGVRQPGYHTISHGVTERGDYERHEVNIAAASRQIAEFAAKYDVAAPSNIDFATAEIEVVESNITTERDTFSTFNIIVDVADRGEKEV